MGYLPMCRWILSILLLGTVNAHGGTQAAAGSEAACPPASCALPSREAGAGRQPAGCAVEGPAAQLSAYLALHEAGIEGMGLSALLPWSTHLIDVE